MKPSVDAIFNMLNGWNDKEHRQMFAYLVMREHRTLQQNLMRLIVTVIKAWAEQDDCDLRNEGTIALAKIFLTVIEEKGYLLPYI